MTSCNKLQLPAGTMLLEDLEVVAPGGMTCSPIVASLIDGQRVAAALDVAKSYVGIEGTDAEYAMLHEVAQGIAAAKADETQSGSAKGKSPAAKPCARGGSMTKDQLSPCPEVTDEMIEAGVAAWHRTNGLLDEEVRAIYLAMHQASSPQDGGWRPIETAPQDGESILAICNSAYSPKANVTWWSGAWTLYSRPDDKWHGGVSKWWPTHWMPLPAPPTLTGVSTNG